MATKAKRRYVSKNDLEEMLQALYNGLGDNENTSLEHRFPDEYEVDTQSYSGDDDDDDDDDDNGEDNEMNNGYKMEEEESEIEDNSNAIITMRLFLKKRLLAVKLKKQRETK